MLTSKLVLAVAVLLAPNTAISAETRIISVPNAPLEITFFYANYSQGTGSYPQEEITMRTQVKNVSHQAVTAYGIGFHAFDAFNDLLGNGLSGISIKRVGVGQEMMGEWAYKPAAAFKFKNFGTGIAYVSKVRFHDGTVWKADLGDVLREMQKIEDSLTLDDLSMGEE